MDAKFENGVLTLHLKGRLDGTNSDKTTEEIRKIIVEYKAEEIILDCDGLEYISSAGLRVLLRLKKEKTHTKLINANPDIYSILDTTGFTEFMEVRKAYRVLSLKTCTLIGKGANGSIYKIDPENIVKVYTDPNALPEIWDERELARTAFVNGVPTAIPYDVVKIEEGGFGAVYELIDAKTFAQVLIDGEEPMDKLVEMSIDALRTIHAAAVKPDIVPSIKVTVLFWVMYLKDYLPSDQFEKLYALVDAVPEDLHLVHGDYHFKNIMYQNGEAILIDMGKLSYGHPVFELAQIYNSYRGFGEVDPELSERFIGIPYEVTLQLWRKSLEMYLGTTDEKTIRRVEEKAMLIGQTRIMRHYIRRGGMTSGNGREQIDHAAEVIADLLTRVDSLLF